MAKRQDSENQRPNPHDEDRLPEFTENTRGRADDEAEEEADEFEDDDMDEESDEKGGF